ncbi:hypothetical protein ACTACT_09910 [Pseudomonas syringae]|uniref:hypothetical protein n=1 Tax=Pseudomonas syringae TaxID=317 RepID=UPI003F75588C
MPAAGSNITKPLLAFWVGEYDIYAAEDAAQALNMANGMTLRPTAFILDDVSLVQATTLDERLAGEHGEKLGWTLRRLLLDTAEPSFLAGYN